MAKITMGYVVKTSLVTAFTIAAALIWKDFIETAIGMALPPAQRLAYQLMAAVIATVFVVLAIYFILKTEDRIERAERDFERRRKLRK